MKDDVPMVFDHVSASEGGNLLSFSELSSFAAGIASSYLSERGFKVGFACRLLRSEIPIVITDDSLYAVPVKMFPDVAELDDESKKEAASLAASLSKKLFSLPVSLYCLSGNGSEAISGAGYVVKMGEPLAI